MSSYESKGVTIDAVGGGVYEISHKSLPVPEKVRGKDKAEARATEIAAALPDAPNDDTVIDQGDLAAAAAAVRNSPETKPAPDVDKLLDAKDAEIATLKAQLAAMPTATVSVTEGAVPDHIARPHAAAPRSYDGLIDDKAKKALGLEFVRIVLEENDDIPPTGLFISHNGRPYVIQCGDPVDVPKFLVDVLDDAKISAPVVDPKTRKVLGYRDRTKYPYRKL